MSTNWYRPVQSSVHLVHQTSLLDMKNLSVFLIRSGLDKMQIISVFDPYFDYSIVAWHFHLLDDIPNGIVSCLATGNKMFAAGSFSKLIGLYDTSSLENIAMLQGHKGGLTHLLISPDGNQLYSGARKVFLSYCWLLWLLAFLLQDPEILCWDLRNYGSICHIVKRNCFSNQRIYFDIDFEKNILITGDEGYIKFYDLKSPPNDDKSLSSLSEFISAENCVNGVGYVLPILMPAWSMLIDVNLLFFHFKQLSPNLAFDRIDIGPEIAAWFQWG